MKKIYILLLLSAFTFQSALAQNELQNPYVVAKEDGFSYRSLKKLIDLNSLYVGSQFERPYHDLMSILYSRVGHPSVMTSAASQARGANMLGTSSLNLAL